ncbi:LUTEIN DEFICIENT 5 [Spatholobus suberectus]|nr:LUTEIN DEFICIENT 5 [Spatholobus suberectus]
MVVVVVIVTVMVAIVIVVVVATIMVVAAVEVDVATVMAMVVATVMTMVVVTVMHTILQSIQSFIDPLKSIDETIISQQLLCLIHNLMTMVLNCGCGFVAILDIVGNCGKMWLMRPQLRSRCGCGESKNLYVAAAIVVVDLTGVGTKHVEICARLNCGEGNSIARDIVDDGVG